MSDSRPYGVTQNPDAAMVTADQLVGTRAGSVQENAAIDGIGPAMHSTAPYVPPRPANYDGRRAALTCTRENCGQLAKKGTDYCRWHQPDEAA